MVWETGTWSRPKRHGRSAETRGQQVGRNVTRSAWPFPSVVLDRLKGMHTLRQIALVILFAGWMVPAVLAQKANERAAATAPVRAPRGHLDQLMGVEPPPPPAERVLTMLRTIAGLWFLIALVYASVLTIRFRRTLIS